LHREELISRLVKQKSELKATGVLVSLMAKEGAASREALQVEDLALEIPRVVALEPDETEAIQRQTGGETYVHEYTEADRWRDIRTRDE
jgi:hypothetical protein